MYSLDELHAFLNSVGVPKRGRNKAVADKTGYSQGMVAKLLTGHSTLTERFLIAIRRAFIGSLPEIKQHERFNLVVDTKDIIGRIDDWDTSRGSAIRELLLHIGVLDTDFVIELVESIRTKHRLRPEYIYTRDSKTGERDGVTSTGQAVNPTEVK